MPSLWSFLFRRPLAPRARSGPIVGRSCDRTVRLEIEPLEGREVPTAAVGSGTGLLAQYFTNPNLTGQPALTRADPDVNLNLTSQQTPAPGLPTANWSARWTGLVQAQYSQAYTFTTLSDDGVRLFVNGQMVINDWSVHAPTTDSATISLVAGQKYAIEMDYYQGTGGAVAQLSWSSPSTPKQVIPASQLYPASPSVPTVAISAGGKAAGDFSADVDYNGGSTYSTTAAINTGKVNSPAPQAVYQTERYGNFTYAIPGLAPGAPYTVRLDFAEIYWDAAGQRLFNVAINGTQVLTNFDIFATAGGKNIAVAESFTTAANASGQVVLTFTSVKDTAKVDGIEITPVFTASTTTVSGPFIHAGGGATGNFIADTDFNGGTTYSTTAAINTSKVSNPAPQTVYQTERYGNFTYTIPSLTPGASYTVRLDFSENYVTGAGQRKFNVSINGTQVLTSFDIYATAGGKNIAIAESFTATADSSGHITIVFTSVVNAAKVDGIEITPAPAGSPPVSDWFSQNLHDAALAQLARTDDADKQLSRADLLQLFAFVDQGSTVSSTDLADLRTLVANASTLGMPGYVQDLANKVLNGDPAGATYQGKSLPALAAGSPGSVLQDLVNKWFLGLDLPAAGTGVQYVMASGSLFGTGPSYTDIKQGSVSDCYFLAALGEVAYRSPSTIQSMFINNGDGTYTVRFYKGGPADYVTVNLALPEASDGTFLFANFEEPLSDPSNKLWVALAEKAYAQLAASGWSRGAGAASAYGSIALGWEGNALAQLTGGTATLNTLSASAATESALINAAAAGRMVGLDTNAVTATGIVPNHVYVMIGYNSSTQLFTMYNPWGYVQQLSWAQVTANFDFWSEE